MTVPLPPLLVVDDEKNMRLSLQTMLGDEAAAFSKLATLVSQVPCYALVASGDASALSDGLGRLVAGAAAQ